MTALRCAHDPILLAARRLIASVLSDALLEPGPAAPRAPLPAPALITGSWDLIAAPFADHPQAALGLGELPPGGADPDALSAWLRLPLPDRAAALHAVLSGHGAAECPPIESRYSPRPDAADTLTNSIDLPRLAADLDLPAAHPTDHIAALLELTARLLERLASASLSGGIDAAAADRLRHDDRTHSRLIDLHLAWWAPTFAQRLERRAERLSAADDLPPDRAQALHHLAGVARLLRSWLAAERLTAGITPSRRLVSPIPSPRHAGGNGQCCGVCTGCGKHDH